LKDRLSEHLRAVERGAEIEITDRDRPIARLIPVRDASSSFRVMPPRRPFVEVRDKRYPRARSGVDFVSLLLEERRKR
jgi:prevent-host-death family protein